jgi:hypothetical protein
MMPSQARLNKIPGSTIIMSLVLLAGVLSMAYGHHHNGQVMLYTGIAVTAATAFNLIIMSLVSPNGFRIMGRRR